MQQIILGLDLGEASIGWAFVKYEDDQPSKLMETGVRIFEPGMEGDIEAGRGESRGVTRRNARQVRRQTARRAMRKKHVHRWLIKMGLLPDGLRSLVLPELDKKLIAIHKDNFDSTHAMQLDQLLPYWLRARALDHPLSEEELGRVFFHLAQRRGFLSNRKSPKKKDEEAGKVSEGILKLIEGIQKKDVRTLGEYFAQLNPHEKRIRVRYTHRDMYIDEFEKIWAAQKPHHPAILTDDNHDALHHALFHQRPLKSARHLVGKCDLEPRCRKAAWASIQAQRFRMRQAVNNLEILHVPTGELFRPNQEQREALCCLLERKGDQSWAALKTKGLKYKSKEVKFNLEEGGDKKMPGNQITAAMVEVFGDAWFNIPSAHQAAIIHDVHSIRNPDVLETKARKIYQLDRDSARQLAETVFEPGFCSLSRRAIGKILPLLEQGLPYATARKQIYGDNFLAGEAMDTLPPVDTCFDIRNPVVSRCLTELRHLINHLIVEIARPDMIKIELARNIKQSAKRRKATLKKNTDNQREREKAKKAIYDKTGDSHPSRDDVLKYQLREECGGFCPYTGRGINMEDLFGDHPLFDIEHIIPYSRSLDDSYLNKTLCYADENRHVKTNKTPYEAYHKTDGWDRIINAVRGFRGPARDAKLRRFQMTPEDVSSEEFVSRQLNDTAYASRLAAEYLGHLFGGQVDANHRRRVFPVAGRITALLRREWKMNDVLGYDGEKSRDDRRHHAVDAAAIALTTPGIIQRLTEAALPHHERRRRRSRFEPIPTPWDTFKQDLAESIEQIMVSHRQNHKVSGPLHKDTNYGRPRPGTQGKFTVRRTLDALKLGELNKITDLRVRKLVNKAFASLQKEDPSIKTPKDAFTNVANHPTWTTNTGLTKVIHRVRVEVSASPRLIGRNDRQRLITTKSNNHMEIFAHLDEEGLVTQWDAKVVDLLEAYRRRSRREPIVQRDHGENTKFLFSLSGKEVLKLGNHGNWPEFLLVRTIAVSSTGRINISGVSLTDGRMKKDITDAKEFYQIQSLGRLQELAPEKVVILPSGKVRRAKD